MSPLHYIFILCFVNTHLIPEAVHHIEKLEEVHKDHGVRWSIQTLLLHLSQRHGKVDQTLNNETNPSLKCFPYKILYINNLTTAQGLHRSSKHL